MKRVVNIRGHGYRSAFDVFGERVLAGHNDEMEIEVGIGGCAYGGKGSR